MGTLNTAVSTQPDTGKRPPSEARTVAEHKSSDFSYRSFRGENEFATMLCLERRRSERARKRFFLMLVDVSQVIRDRQKKQVLSRISSALTRCTRVTDVIGWYLEDHIIGVIGTEIGEVASKVVKHRLLEKLCPELREAAGPGNQGQMTVSFHFFPEDSEDSDRDPSADCTLYPDVLRKTDSHKFALGIKRAMDVVGSAVAFMLFSPLFLAIAVAIKLTSKGPVLFRQPRLGQYGKSFTFLKFRSMRTDCDSRIHEEYVSQFISGRANENPKGDSAPVYKLQQDPRITSVGRFLRKTSLDELPQFWNVMRGEMSLVGPRPPIAYEYKAYELWHRRRVLEIKPGITGLWQVEGRSRTRFDDMVRLDLKYAQAWSIWLDVRILLQTPGAVLTGQGAH